MKTCSKCKVSKPLSDFCQKGGGKTNSWCKSCHNGWVKARYKVNKGFRQKKITASMERQKRRIEANSLVVNELKSKPCLDCNRTFDPVAMDFDHVSGKKDADISTMIRGGRSLKRILLEIAKCELVCANCHRVRTSKRCQTSKVGSFGS